MDSAATAHDFETWQTKAYKMTIDQLGYAIHDCYSAARAMRDHNPVREGRYMDEAATYRTEMNRRTR
jgi:hypothetical protein